MNTLKRAMYVALVAASSSLWAAAPITDNNSDTLNARLATLERLMQARNQSQLGIQQQLDTLLDEVNQLRGSTEIHGHKLEQLVERQRELYQELEDRFSRYAASNVQAQTTPAVVVTPAANGAQPITYSESVSENAAYDRATNLVLKERRYDEAIPEFRAFIKQFPDSAYAANAYYWLGQLLFNKGSYIDAKAQFDQVMNYYPDSNKRDDAILKLGLIALKSNDKGAAKVFFDQVIAEYPGSASAKLATARLQTIK